MEKGADKLIKNRYKNGKEYCSWLLRGIISSDSNQVYPVLAGKYYLASLEVCRAELKDNEDYRGGALMSYEL